MQRPAIGTDRGRQAMYTPTMTTIAVYGYSSERSTGRQIRPPLQLLSRECTYANSTSPPNPAATHANDFHRLRHRAARYQTITA